MTQPVNNEGTPAVRSMDYDALYREGIEWVQRYAGAIWTDYNLHDPGVTLLEYLCFGITDVGYRCNLPVEDLLYSRENKKLELQDNAFFFPHEILPCAPLTQDDYRRLLLDRMLTKVANLWVDPVVDPEKGFQGLYDIRLQLNEEMEHTENREKEVAMVEEKIRRLFVEHRNLCEDIRHVQVLERKLIDLQADINLQADASAEQVLADLIITVEHFLAPRPRLYSFEALQSEGMDTNQILEGPVPKYGFIKTDELLPQPPDLRQLDSLKANANFEGLDVHQIVSQTIDLVTKAFRRVRNVDQLRSELRDVVANIDGIQRIKALTVAIENLSQADEQSMGGAYLALGKLLENPGAPPIRLERNGRQVHPNYVVVHQILNAHRAREYKQMSHPLDLRKPTPHSDKDLADIGAYYSIQRFFPAVYGIGPYGLPRDADFKRQAQARQLKGYLAIFELMLASYLKELTQLRYLFSTGKKAAFIREDQIAKARGAEVGDMEETSLFQFDPDIEALFYLDKPYQGDKQLQINRELAKHAALSNRSLERRNEFLDHLLARFGETFNGDLLQNLSAHNADLRVLQRASIEAKCRILREYAGLSRDRSLGFNYLKPLQEGAWPVDNVSGLKKRLYFWLNWAKEKKPEPEDMETSEGAMSPPIFNFESGGTTDIFPFENFDLKSGKPADGPGLPLHDLILNGDNPAHYHIKESPTSGDFEVYFKTTNNAEALVLGGLFTKEAADYQLDMFISQIKLFKQNSQGFFVVEHLLLRPQAPNTIEAPEDEARILSNFCNHRLSIVSPAWSPLSIEKDARRSFEQQVAQEVPAHLRVDFHWLPWDAMKKFEAVYKAWLHEKSKSLQPDADVAKLDTLSLQLRNQLTNQPINQSTN